MRTYAEKYDETSLKFLDDIAMRPIYDIANVNEDTSFEDLFLFLSIVSNKPQIQSPAIIVGFND